MVPANRQRNLPGESYPPGSLHCRFARNPRCQTLETIPVPNRRRHMRRRLPVFSMFALLFLGFAGCSSEELQIAPVSGRVTMDGKPVDRAALMFQPAGTKDNINPGR